MAAYSTKSPARFTTHSRDEAIEASIMLVRGIGSPRILAETTKILIVGGDGKSLIVDAIARHLSDHHGTENMPAERFVESAPFAATDRKEKKRITHHNQDCTIALTHIFDRESKALRPQKTGWLHAVFNRFSPAIHEGLHFVTTHRRSTVAPAIRDGHFAPDITIAFDPADGLHGPENWRRHWAVSLHNPQLMTPAMKDALAYLSAPQNNRMDVSEQMCLTYAQNG